ncbi:MAG: hypothetical protein AAGE84_15505 [Cyanobacteria bacterium P01_G01_bin.39]
MCALHRLFPITPDLLWLQHQQEIFRTSNGQHKGKDPHQFSIQEFVLSTTHLALAGTKPDFLYNFPFSIAQATCIWHPFFVILFYKDTKWVL